MVTRKQVEHPAGDDEGSGSATEDATPGAGISGHVNKKAAKGNRRAAAPVEAPVPPESTGPSGSTGPVGRKGRKGKKLTGGPAPAGESTRAGGTGAGTAQHRNPGSPTGQVIVRSEEQVRVIPQTKQLGRVRLSKTVVTENVTRTVTIRREEIRIERLPRAEAGVVPGPGPTDSASGGIGGSELENGGYSIVLAEERPAVRMETVAIKRIRLSKDMILTEESLNAEVRKEVLDTGAIGDSTRNQAPASRSTDDYAG